MSAISVTQTATIDTAPMGLELAVETPENVVLTYQLAGPATRACAYLLDLAVRVCFMLVVAVALSLVGFALPGLSTGVTLLIVFVVEWGYFVICEGFFDGKTIGKHALGLRVIHERGYPLTLWAAVLRNVVRAADAFPMYGTAFVSMTCSRKFQRLGDLAAGTVVVTERRVVLPREPIILEKIQPIPQEELGAFRPHQETLTLIDQFLGRRHVLSHGRGHTLAWLLAQPLAAAIHYRGDRRLVERYPMAFLARVYVTFQDTGDERDSTSTSAAATRAS